MEHTDDDFGELYADIEFPTSSKINNEPDFSQPFTKTQQQQQLSISDVEMVELRENDVGEAGGKRCEKDSKLCNNEDELIVENGTDCDDDDDDVDDFVVFVNDEDFGAKNGSGDATKCSEEIEGAFVADLSGNDQMRVVVNGVEQNDNGFGVERVNVAINGGNSQCKYPRRNGSYFVGNQRATSSWRSDKQDVWSDEPRVPGLTPGFDGNGNNFWLPWYRTIMDVDIHTIEHKPWTYPGADVTDYFNFGFDEESWRNYCRSLDQLRGQMLSQIGNQVNENLSFKLENKFGPSMELQSDELVGAQAIPSGLKIQPSHELEFSTRQFKKQIGQAIHVKDSNIERQPSADARRPRISDSDVIIQLTTHDPVEPSRSRSENLDNALETQYKSSEKRCGNGNPELEAEKSGGSKAYEMGKVSFEERFRCSSMSSDCKRSHESAVLSSQLHQHFDDHGKVQKSKLEVLASQKAETINSSMEDVDYGSTTHSRSYSNSWSEASKDDHCDSRRARVSRRIQDTRSLSSNSIKENINVDYQCSRKKGDIKKVKESGGKYCLRVKNSVDVSFKKNEPRVHRRLEVKIRTGFNEDNGRIDIADDYGGVGCAKAHRRRIEEWHPSSDDDDYWPSHREDNSSPGWYERQTVENRLQKECSSNFDQQDHWGLRDEGDLFIRREWDTEQFFFDRTQRRGVIVKKDWHLRERECIIKDEKPYFHDRRHSTLNFSSSHDVDRSELPREYNDDHFVKRSKHRQASQYGYLDERVNSRYMRSNTLDDRRSKYSDSDIEHESCLWQSGRELRSFDEEDEYFEGPLTVDYARYTVDDEDECRNRHTSAYIHDNCDVSFTYDNRRHQNTLIRDDADDLQLYQRYERHSRSISAKRGTGIRQANDRRDAYSRKCRARYLDEEDYFEKRKNVSESKFTTWTKDAEFDGYLDNSFRGKNMPGSFKGAPRPKWYGSKNGFSPTWMEMPLRGNFGVVSDGVCKSEFKLSTRANSEENRLWGWNSMEMQHVVRGKKVNLGHSLLFFYSVVIVSMISPQTLGGINCFSAFCMFFLICFITCIFSSMISKVCSSSRFIYSILQAGALLMNFDYILLKII
ncbi:unnamed protein product [Amaranthus hypochondriacus]